MTFISKIKSKNKWPYIGNVAMGVAISSMVFTLSMPVGGALTWALLDGPQIAKLVKLIPEWMHFVELENLEHFTPEVNFFFYASLIFAITITAATVFMLYKTHKNSKEIGENNCKSRILVTEEKQTISYITNGNGKGTSTDPIYVTLEKRYPGVCIVKSKSGKKIVTLKYSI